MLRIRQRGLSRTSASVVRGRAVASRRTSSAVTGTTTSLAGGAVDRLPDQVGVAVVAGVLLDHVHVDPADVPLAVAMLMLRRAGDDLVERLSLDRCPGRRALLLE